MNLIISDIDDTLAPPFKEIDSELLSIITQMLRGNVYLFMMTGQSFNNAFNRVVKLFPEDVLDKVYLGSCNGSEVCAFDGYMPKVVFSAVENTNRKIDFDALKGLLDKISREYKFHYIRCNSIDSFIDECKLVETSDLLVMYEDKSLQVTIDFICPVESEKNGVLQPIDNVEVIRHRLIDHLNAVFDQESMGFSAIAGGTSAVDIVIQGVNKGLPIKSMLSKGEAFSKRGDTFVYTRSSVEIWGDSFSRMPVGNDRYICESLPDVKAISFRHLSDEDTKGFENLRQWNGDKRLSEGLKEYLLQSAVSA